MKTELLQPLINFWRGLGERERLIVSVGGAAASVLLLYGLVWSPLKSDLTRLREAVPREQAQLEWMRTQASRVQQLRAQASTTTNSGGLLSFVDQSAASYQLKSTIKNIQPEGANSVRVTIEGAHFDVLLRWLANLHKQGAVRVESATVDSQSAPGIVNARLQLRSAGL